MRSIHRRATSSPSEYELYSQRFQREDFSNDDPFNPKLLPNEYLTAPNAEPHVRLCLHHPAHGAESFRCARIVRAVGWRRRGRGRCRRPRHSIHAFDLIIADECHRGYTAQEMSVWRNTLQHFDAIKIGLTATPAAHTMALFGEPVFRYGSSGRSARATSSTTTS